MNITIRLVTPLTILLCLQGCAAQKSGLPFGQLEKINRADASNPGYFDVGAGFAQLFNTHSGDDNDARGLMITFKGYPWGRSYATEEPKKILVVASVVEAEANMQALAKAKSEMPDADAAGAKDKDNDKHKDKEDKSGEASEGGESDYKKYVVLAGDIETLRKNRKSVYCYKELTECRDRWYHRLSIYYGISSDNFVGGAVDSTVHSIGFGYDVTPERALLLGVGFFDSIDPVSAVTDSDAAVIFGVSLNLNAFSSLWKSAAGD